MAGGTRPGPIPLTAAAVAAVLVAAIGLVGASTVRSAIGAGTSSYSDPLTTNGDLVVRSGGATTRLGTASAPDGGVLTVANGAPSWAAAASGSTDPTEALPSPTTCVLYLRPEGITQRDGEWISQWRAERGPSFIGDDITGAVNGWASSTRIVAGTSGGIREAVCNGSTRGRAPTIPGTAAQSWTLAVVVRNAQLAGTTRAFAGFGGNSQDTHVAMLSRVDSTDRWALHKNVQSAPTNASHYISSGSYASSTTATLLVARYNGTTLELLTGTAGSGSLASVGTLTVTLNIARDNPVTLCASATAGSDQSTASIRTVIAWSSRLDDTAIGALYTYAAARWL